MEQIVQSRIDVKTPDGTMDVYLHTPPGKGPFPTAIMYIDAFGVRPAMHDMAKRLATHGYLVVLPNLFYRAGSYPPFDRKTMWTDPDERARIMALMGQASGPAVMRDTEAILQELSHQSSARVAQVGVFGYCMGGKLAFYEAGAMPLRIAAAGCFHGGHLATDDPDSPHRKADKIKARLYFGVADNDKSCTPENQAVLKEALDKANVKYQLEVYPGAQHGFAVNDVEVYDKAAAEKHWERLVAVFFSF